MKASLVVSFTVMATAVLLVMSNSYAADPFVDSTDKPYAVLHLGMNQSEPEIASVAITAVDDVVLATPRVGDVHIVPGEYVLTLQESSLVWRQGIVGCARQPEERLSHQIKLVAEAGVEYYLGAEVRFCGRWLAVIWKTSRQGG